MYYNEIKKISSKLPKNKTKKIDIKKRSNNSKDKNKDKKQADPNSPFAVLEKLL